MCMTWLHSGDACDASVDTANADAVAATPDPTTAKLAKGSSGS